MADMDIPEEAGHRVVATARGVFDSSGGVLESKETGTYRVGGLYYVLHKTLTVARRFPPFSTFVCVS